MYTIRSSTRCSNVCSAGIDTEKGYPYNARTETCHYRKADIEATNSGYMTIPSGDKQKLKEALATVGPVSVAVDATQPSFLNYESGKLRFSHPVHNGKIKTS